MEYTLLQEEQETCPVFHTFAPGIYVRELHVPAETFLIGHEHRYYQLNIFLQGKVLMLKEDGSTGILEAPMMFTGPPGRKYGVVLNDMVWLNVFSTDMTELCHLEEMFFRKSETWYDIESGIDPSDHGFFNMSKELGVSPETIRAESERTDDLMQMPFGTYKCGVHYSPIDGKGIFATAKIYEQECIGAARVGSYRTPIGRYLNHSDNPNAVPHVVGEDILVFALRDIPGCQGGELGEEILIDYRQAFNLPRR